jgi:hypothetical protein
MQGQVTLRPLMPILSQANQKQVPILFEYYSPIYVQVFQVASFPSGFPTTTVYASLLPSSTCYMPRPTNSSSFDHPNNIWWGNLHINIEYTLHKQHRIYRAEIRLTENYTLWIPTVKLFFSFILDFAVCLGRELWRIGVDGEIWKKSEEDEWRFFS